MSYREIDTETKNNWKILSNYLIGNWVTQTIAAAVKLGIIGILSEKAVKFEEIYTPLHLDPGACMRLLRALVGLKILHYSNGFFSLSKMGLLLTEKHPWSLAKAAQLWSEEHYRTWADLSNSIKTGQASFDKLYGMNFFDWLSKNFEKRELYHLAMEKYSNHDYHLLTKYYDFSKHKVVMDIGGGAGILLETIVRSVPNILGILLERPEVIQITHKNLDNSDVKGRIEIISGNFFEEILVKADLIILARILHDWNDEKALLILQNCYKALSKDGRILIIELILPNEIESSFGALLNLNMLVMTGGQERTLDEYRNLLKKAQFDLAETYPTDTINTILVAEKDY